MALSWMAILLTLNNSKKLIVILLNLSKPKKLIVILLTLVGWLLLEWLLHGWLLLGWLLRMFSLCKTPLGETGCLGNPYFILNGCLSIQLFDSPLTRSVRPPMVTYPSLCSTCVTYGTSCHVIGNQVLPSKPLPREAWDFPRGERHFNHVPPLT